MYLTDDLMIGGNTGIINLLKYLDKSQYRIIVCCLSGGPLKESLNSLDIKVEILDFHRKKIASFIKLIKLLKTSKIDILHTYCFTPHTLGRLAALFARVPAIICSEWALVDKRSRFQHFIDKFLSYFTKKIIAVSEAVKKSIILYEKIPESKITVIYNCVDLDKFSLRLGQNSISNTNPYNNWPIIGMIANFRWEKAHHIFIKSAKIIIKQYPNAKFLVVGEGLGVHGQKVKKEIEELVRTLDLSNNVIFMGARDDIPEILRSLTIKVLSSVSEGLPLSLIEAMALSKPVVATMVGGIPEIVVDKVTGLLVAPNDEVVLANAISKILSDKELAYRMGMEGRRRVEKIFDARKVVKELETVYQQALKNN